MLDVVTTSEGATVEELIKTMTAFHIIRLPIVQDDNLVGIVSRGDVLRSLIEPEFVAHM
ncbi:MAG: CBS domain-containing protein [Nitrospinae bacterium]|nr:CBS domain-containing protein [Nitrospinota bacterium]